MKSYIVWADKLVMCVAWTLVSLLRLILLPLHLITFTIFKGCEEVISMTTEMQGATVARIKAE